MIWIPKWLADIGFNLNRYYYKRRLDTVYNNSKQLPSWFDHRIDLYYIWPENLFWLERGILPRKYMFKGCTVLDLFCGDGFFSRYFYSTIAGTIDAVDKDRAAIEHAKKQHSQSNIHYYQLDAVQENFPKSHYDVVVWFEGIEHLSQEHYKAVVKRIRSVLNQTGVLIGSTPIVPKERLGLANWEHQNEFISTNQLRDFLSCDFSNVTIDTTVYPEFGGNERCTAYFTASNN